MNSNQLKNRYGSVIVVHTWVDTEPKDPRYDESTTAHIQNWMQGMPVRVVYLVAATQLLYKTTH